MLTTIRAAESSMTRAERKVAEFVLTQPDNILRTSIAVVAADAGVSEPTVIRFCRTLGCRGYQDFKLQLAQDLATDARFNETELEIGETTSSLIAKVIDGGIASLTKIRNSLPVDIVQSAIELLAAASRIEIYGAGGSGIVAADAQHKFFRLGVPVIAYSDPTVHAISAAMLNPGSVVVAISQGGRTRDLLTSVESALATGADVIAVTASGSPLALMASLCLPVNLLADEDFYAPIKSRLAHLAILDVLSVGVALRRGPEIQQHLGSTI